MNEFLEKNMSCCNSCWLIIISVYISCIVGQSSGWIGAKNPWLYQYDFIPLNSEYTIQYICGYANDTLPFINGIGNITWSNGVSGYTYDKFTDTPAMNHGNAYVSCFKSSCINYVKVYNSSHGITRLELRSDTQYINWGKSADSFATFECDPGYCLSTFKVKYAQYIDVINVECTRYANYI